MSDRNHLNALKSTAAGRRRRGIVLVSLVTAVVTALAGCASAAPTAAGGDLKIAIPADPVCLDPAQMGPGAEIMRHVAESLTTVDPTTGDILPWLAERWDVNADSTEFRFVLAPGITFSDGTPLDAASVKTAFDAIVSMGALAWKDSAYLRGYVGTTVVDDRTATVTFEQPNAPFLAASSNMAIMAPASAAVDPTSRCDGSIVGTGPYVVESYTPNESVVLAARDGYTSPPSNAGRTGRAAFDTVTYRIAPEASVRVGLLSSGQVDVAELIPTQDQPALESSGVTLLSFISGGVVTGMAPDMSRDSVLQDVEVRKAVQLALDRASIAEVVLTPAYGVATSVIGDTNPYWEDFSALLKVDAAEAGRVLDAAGWTLGADGIREKAGRKLAATVLYESALNSPVYEYTQQLLRQVGFDLQLNEVGATKFLEELTSGNWDLNVTANAGLDAAVIVESFEPAVAYVPYLTEDTPGLSTLRGWFGTIMSSSDRQERLTAAANAQRWLLENNYMFPLSQSAVVTGVAKNIEGLRLDGAGLLITYGGQRVS